MAKKIFTVHGQEHERTGKCNRCGVCCERCQCPHFKWIDGVATCLIYDTRDQICKECSEKQGQDVDHKICIIYPNHPYIKEVEEGVCGYKFSGDKIIWQ